MKTKLNILPLLLLASASQLTLAEDGSILHEKNCIACHAAMTGGDGSVLYTRNNRNVTTSDALTKQINRCQSSLALNWSEQQINAVHSYLNKMYYNF